MFQTLFFVFSFISDVARSRKHSYGQNLKRLCADKPRLHLLAYYACTLSQINHYFRLIRYETFFWEIRRGFGSARTRELNVNRQMIWSTTCSPSLICHLRTTDRPKCFNLEKSFREKIYLGGNKCIMNTFCSLWRWMQRLKVLKSLKFQK